MLILLVDTTRTVSVNTEVPAERVMLKKSVNKMGVKRTLAQKDTLKNVKSSTPIMDVGSKKSVPTNIKRSLHPQTKVK